MHRFDIHKNASLLLISLAALSSCGSNSDGSASAGSSSAGAGTGSTLSTGATAASSGLSSDPTAGNLQIVASSDALSTTGANATLNISEIDVRPAGGDFAVFSAQPTALDLSQIGNGSILSLAQATVAAGSYDAVRVTLSSLSTATNAGEQISITFPVSSGSGPQEGVADAILSSPAAIASDAVTHLLIKFASEQSFSGPHRFSGADSGLFLQLINYDLAGTLSGTLTDASSGAAIANAFVVVQSGRQVVASTIADADGNYQAIGLAPGQYEVLAFANGYQPNEAGPSTVTAAQTTAANLTLTAVSIARYRSSERNSSALSRWMPSFVTRFGAVS